MTDEKKERAIRRGLALAPVVLFFGWILYQAVKGKIK